MKKLVVDLGRCTGCRMCQITCALSHEAEANFEWGRIRIWKNDRLGLSTPIPCSQCVRAPCMSVCPTEAIFVDERGAKVIDEEKCIVCEACVQACPFGAVVVIHQENGDRVVKCDLCNGDPECVKHCETKAIRYAEADELSGERVSSLGERLLNTIREIKGMKAPEAV